MRAGVLANLVLEKQLSPQTVLDHDGLTITFRPTRSITIDIYSVRSIQVLSTNGAQVVGRGYHIALAREHAKRLFAQKDDENLRLFLEELKSSPEVKKSGRLLDLGTTWDPIHRCLTEGELDPAGGDFPLNTAILGGKKLHQGDDYAAMLIRPDMNIFIAEALAEVDEMEFRQKFFALNPESYKGPITDKAFIEIWLTLQKLKVFFEESAENLEAVVFTASYSA